MQQKTFIIGIAGGSGSGKTTLSRNIYKHFGASKINLILHDYYYRDQSLDSISKRQLVNYDHPDSLESELLVKHLRQLKAGKIITTPTYDFVNHTRSDKSITFKPSKIIIIEGILIFIEQELRELFNLKIFVDTPGDIRFIRRLNRDIKYRGRTRKDVITQYLKTVRPMHRQFVEPSKRYADIIIPEGGKNPIAIDTLVNQIKTQLK